MRPYKKAAASNVLPFGYWNLQGCSCENCISNEVVTSSFSTTQAATTTTRRSSFTIDSLLRDTRPSSATGLKMIAFVPRGSYSSSELGKLNTPDPPRGYFPSGFQHASSLSLNQMSMFERGTMQAERASFPMTRDEAEWSSEKPKRMRTIFTMDQLERLEMEFTRQQYMVGGQRFYLSKELGLTETQVKVWFQNRRIKWRKQLIEQQRSKIREQKERNIVGQGEEKPFQL